MKVLIIHHLESTWEYGYQKQGTSLEELVEKFRRHLARAKYDRVILTRFEDNRLEPEHYPISDYIDIVHEYDYGWTPEMFRDPSEYCEGGYHSEVVWLADWLKDLKHKRATVCIGGAFDGECIEDLEVALRHLKIPYKRLDNLIV